MNEYLSPDQRDYVQKLLQTPAARTEWPTWLLLALVYGGWFVALYFGTVLGAWGQTALLIVVCAWYLSLQHELVHGHPSRYGWLNKLLGYAPLAVWFPFTVYSESHLRHHRDQDLTDPEHDPETHYVSAQEWERCGALARWLYTARKSFWGWCALGPAMAVTSMLLQAMAQPFQGNFRYLCMWALHLGVLGCMLLALDRYADISPLHYVFGVAYPALSLAMVRSFYEHRAAVDCKHRITINEASLPMRLLFLNNNYHLVHHDLPSLPWYLLPKVYRRNRGDYLARSGDFLVPGYSDWIRRFGFRPVDNPVHPGNSGAMPP